MYTKFVSSSVSVAASVLSLYLDNPTAMLGSKVQSSRICCGFPLIWCEFLLAYSSLLA
jgi:hypothetical protein